MTAARASADRFSGNNRVASDEALVKFGEGTFYNTNRHQARLGHRTPAEVYADTKPSYVDWYNHRRSHGEILDGPRYITPAQHEANHYNQIAVTETVTA